MVFASKLREVRVRRALAQQSVAEAINVSLRAYQFYEQGTREPSLDSLIRLADFLNVSVDYLLGRIQSFEDFVR